MKKLTKLALLVIITAMAWLDTTAQQLTLTVQQAVQLIKSQRTDSANLTADFYAARVADFVHDGISFVDTVNIPSWVIGGELKNLVFVDETPGAKWVHQCSYYYVSGTQTSPLVYRLEGLLPPLGVNLQPMDVKLDESNFASIPSIAPTHPQFPGDVQMETGTHVFLLVDVVNQTSYEKTNTQSWKESAALYNVLTRRYRIPKSNIHVLMGSIEYGEDENGYVSPSDTVMYDDQGNRVPLIKDLDGDGLSDVESGSDLGDYENLCDSLSGIYNEGDIEHLFFCYIGNTRIYPETYDGNAAQTNTGIFAGELNMAFWLKAQKQTFMFDCPFASTFMHYISHRENVVLMGTQQEFDPDFLVSDHGEDLFFKYWLNALAGYNVNYPETTVNSDINLDGYVTLFEAFKYAKDNHPSSRATCESMPSGLVKELSFDLNTRTDLKVHQGSGYNSPDIWMRNDSDGFVNQTQGRIYASNNNRVKYIYIRVHNDGRNTYRENDRFIYLYWQKPSMGKAFRILENHNPDNGNFIDYVAITDSIASGSSIIVQCQWYLPDNLLSYAQTNGGLLPITLIAQVYNYEGEISAPQNYAKTTKIVFNPDQGKYVYENDGLSMARYIKNSVPISCAREISRIAVAPHGSNYNMFGNMNIGLKFSDNCPISQMYYDNDYFSVDNGDSQRLRILASGSDIFGMPTTTDKAVNFSCHRNNTLQVIHPYYHEDFGLEFYDNQMRLIDGMDFVCEIDSVDMQQIVVGPGIGVHSMQGGSLMLTAQNVTTDDELNWYDNNLENIGNNEQVVIQPDDASGIVTLQVCRNNNVSYSSVDLSSLVRISDVTYTQHGSIKVTLTAPSMENFSVTATSALHPATSTQVQLTNGNTEVVVPVPTGAIGPLVITLLRGDLVLDSRQIVK